jgi:hypothetical protein
VSEAVGSVVCMADDYRDFDKSELQNYDEDVVAQAAEEYPEIYDNHLQIAAQLDGWARRNRQISLPPTRDYDEGWARALEEVAAHLRQAEYVPDGYLLQP